MRPSGLRLGDAQGGAQCYLPQCLPSPAPVTCHSLVQFQRARARTGSTRACRACAWRGPASPSAGA